MKLTALRAFVSASSLPVIIWPLFGLAMAARRSGADLDFSMVAIVIPLIFGSYNTAVYALGIDRTRAKMFAAGAVLGLMLSSLGVFILHIPESVYGMVGNERFLMLLAGPLFYGSVWALVLFPLEKWLYKTEL